MRRWSAVTSLSGLLVALWARNGAWAQLPNSETTASSPLSRHDTMVDPDGLHYGFSECIDNKRTLFYYLTNKTSCDALDTSASSSVLSKPPVKGLRCDVPCDRGFYLDAEFQNGTAESACRKCPRGTYSLGGGQLFSKMTNSWRDPLPVTIYSECVTRNMYTNEWVKNCESWKASSNGELVSSGQNSDISTRYEASRLFSTLRISATFVREGQVTFQYAVDAEDSFDGLVFQIDGESTMEMVSKTDGWTEVTFLVPEGTHTLAWTFTKDSGTDDGEDMAYIRVIEITGTAFSDTRCHPCGGDLTVSGGDMCAFCEESEYAAPASDSSVEYVCNLCPDDMFSPRGSVGVESCIERRPCTYDDMLEIPADCINGTRAVAFEWIEPRTCDISLEDSIKLPSTITITCNECDPGFFWSNKQRCATCGPRQYYDADDEDCRQCPAGQVSVKELHFGNETENGWRTWPNIFDVSKAQESGWKLTRNALMWVPQASRNIRLGGSSRFPLLFNVTFATTGLFRIAYEMSNLPSSNSSKGSVWLELSIDDALKIHDKVDDTLEEIIADEEDADGLRGNKLAHGAENGTFTEEIPVDVLSNSTKQFRLALRTATSYVPRDVQVKIIHMSFRGAAHGGRVACSACGSGFFPAAEGCEVCPSGTYARQGAHSHARCEKCPPNTFSYQQASRCRQCGNNTYSVSGSSACSAVSQLDLQSENVGESSYNVSYNLTLLQMLVAHDVRSSQLHDGSNVTILSNEPVIPGDPYTLDDTHSMHFGIFQPVSEAWRAKKLGNIAEDYIDTLKGFAYVVIMTITNPKETGGSFTEQSVQFGNVQCSVPPRFKVTNGGSQFAVHPREDGTGVLVSYSRGSPCKSGQLATTQINFICDGSADNKTKPVLKVRDEQHCHFEIEWRTQYACPICTDAYFQELRTECTAGKQTISYSNEKACYGGSRPDGVPIATCSDIVLKGDQLYQVYAAASVVGFVVIVLFISVLVVYRKYRDAYNDYIYLKAKIPSNVVVQSDGSKESTYEFSSGSTSIDASPANTTRPQHDRFSEMREDEMDDPVANESRGLRSV